PPTPGLLQGVLATLRRRTESLSATQKLSLADLGLESAHRAGHAPGEAERTALSSLEEAIGVRGAGAASWLLGIPRPDPEPEDGVASPLKSPDSRALLRLLDG